jgi:hypothetical protein
MKELTDKVIFYNYMGFSLAMELGIYPRWGQGCETREP